MDVILNDPEFAGRDVLFVEYTGKPHGYFASAKFKCSNGGIAGMHFDSPDTIRECAAELVKLADELEARQCATTA